MTGGGAEDLGRALVLTMSFRGDFELARLVCETFDAHAADDVSHMIVVPAADVGLFSELASPRRRIVSEAELLPRWFVKAPLPPRRYRKWFGLPRRDVYLTPFSLPVRGWIAQQILKIAATAAATHEIVAHVDSDTAFIRPFGAADIVRDGRVRLYQDPKPVELASHKAWHAAAERLLDLAPGPAGGEYIDSFVVWRRSVARRLTERIAQVSGRDWIAALARTPHFAEYILYGEFAARSLGLEQAGLYADPRSFCCSRWTEGFSGADDEAAFLAGLRPEHLACLVQSTIPLPLGERRRLVEALTRRAAEQDGRSA